jgi:hypothetical protein
MTIKYFCSFGDFSGNHGKSLHFHLTGLAWMGYDSGRREGKISRQKEGSAMKNLGQYFGFWIPILCLLFSSPSSFAEGPKEPPSASKASEKRLSQTIKEKYQQEMEAVKKDTTQTGQEIEESYKELPGKAGEEFKKTGTALKDAGKEIKEGTAESWQNIKNLFKKK